MFVQRVVMPGSGAVSWTVLGADDVPIEPVDRFLGYLSRKPPQHPRSGRSSWRFHGDMVAELL
jgi:hypothetical protein